MKTKFVNQMRTEENMLQKQCHREHNYITRTKENAHLAYKAHWNYTMAEQSIEICALKYRGVAQHSSYVCSSLPICKKEKSGSIIIHGNWWSSFLLFSFHYLKIIYLKISKKGHKLFNWSRKTEESTFSTNVAKLMLTNWNQKVGRQKKAEVLRAFMSQLFTLWK